MAVRAVVRDVADQSGPAPVVLVGGRGSGGSGAGRPLADVLVSMNLVAPMRPRIKRSRETRCEPLTFSVFTLRKMIQ